jgi:hypothetical protein
MAIKRHTPLHAIRAAEPEQFKLKAKPKPLAYRFRVLIGQQQRYQTLRFQPSIQAMQLRHIGHVEAEASHLNYNFQLFLP